MKYEELCVYLCQDLTKKQRYEEDVDSLIGCHRLEHSLQPEF
jgi:hypothetical protein